MFHNYISVVPWYACVRGRAGLTCMPVMPWHGAARLRGGGGRGDGFIFFYYHFSLWIWDGGEERGVAMEWIWDGGKRAGGSHEAN